VPYKRDYNKTGMYASNGESLAGMYIDLAQVAASGLFACAPDGLEY